jgi:hypothetical protein
MGYCSSPVVTDRHAFAGMGQGHFVALSSADGSVAWQDSLDGDILSSPAITSGRLFAATFAGSIYAWQMQEAAPFAGTFMDSSYCYPNPARGAVSHIRIVTASAGELTITIYTMAEKPATFLSRRMAAGEIYLYDWDLKNVANGAYIAKTVMKYASGKTETKFIKIAVLR